MKCAVGSKVEETGEWLSDDFPGWKCSCCGAHIILDVFRWGHFCPNCGHPMVVNYKGAKVKEKK